ncbi:MAG TPA: ABC transporter ATP-binding protein [Candidatus Acidoferrales bacterium]|nr:ABC transporter ATP-binding protein [Candidatus Acidoferrales bacterium]
MPNPLPPELRWLFPKVKPQLRLHAGSFLLLTSASLLALVTPLSIRWLIDAILPFHRAGLLVIAIALIFASQEGRAVLNALGNYLTFRATQHTARELRNSLLRHLDLLSADYFDQTSVGELSYPFEGPIDEISYFGSDLLPSILRAGIAAGVTLSAMTVLTPLLTLVVAPVVPVFLVLRHRYRRKIGQQADLVQVAKSKFSSFLQEHLSALLQIQLLGQAESQERQGSKLLTDAVSVQDALWKTGVFFSALSNLAIVTAIALSLTGGSLLVFRGALTVGTLVAFYTLLVQLFEPLTSTMEMYARAQRTFASIRQIQSSFAASPSVKQEDRAQALPAARALDVVFRDVSFRYRPQGVGIRISKLEIAHGEKIAIVGPNGAGKSTLVKLLARLYDVEAGEIRIAGLDIRGIALESLRAAVRYLPAQPILFHRSVAENLRIGRPGSTNAELERVLRMVELTKYLDGFPSSLEADIEPGASNLSNGERQRLAIARALLSRPRILILDETTSSLDPISEEGILRTIARVLPQSTLLVVSHRLHAISCMARILVMEKGQIVGDGKPSALKAANPVYAEFLTSTAPLA